MTLVMFNNGNTVIGFILTLITLVHSLFACLISLIIFSIITYHLYYNRTKRRDKVIILLCANIYLSILIYMIILSSMNIQTILGDLYGQDFNSSWCIFIGYMSPVILCVLYYSFVNQAFFRLCRIVYSQYRLLQFYLLYIIIPPIQLILAFVLLSPLLFWHDIIYLSNEHYCYAPFINFRGILWTAFTAYGIPASCLLLIYIRIITFIRQQSNNQARVRRRQQARDLLAIRRILITVSVLIILGVPSIILVIISIISGEENPLSFRITWISLTISMAGLSIAMIFFIPQLKNIVWKKRLCNRIIPVDNILTYGTQMRMNITNL